MRRNYYCFGARIVCCGAILASFSLNAATTNVSTVSPQGATNIVRNIITNNVGNGKLLLVQGTDIVGISTNSFATTNSVDYRALLTETNVWTKTNDFTGTAVIEIGQIDNAYTGTLLASNNVTFTQNAIPNGIWIDNGFGAGLGAWGTNLVFANFANLTMGNVRVLTNIPPNGSTNALVIWLTTNSQSFIPNGIGMLTNDGNGGFGYTTNISQNITINNLTTTNLTVVNSLTVSNIITTNLTVVNSLTTSNFYTVNGNHNTLIVTNALSLTSLGTNKLLRIGADGAVTNIANGSGVLTNDGSGGFSWVTVSGGSSGGASVWIPNTQLTFSGTNLTIDGSGGTNFYVLLTNSSPALFVTPSNIPASKTTNTTFTIFFQQDSTGGRLVNWTNASFKFPGNTAFQPLTNANAVSYVTFTMSPFTNSIFIGDYGVLDIR